MDNMKNPACAKNTILVNITIDPSIQKTRRLRIITTQLIILASYTDSPCAVKKANPNDILTSGMKFLFSSIEKATEFKNKRLKNYLENSIYQMLTIN